MTKTARTASGWTRCLKPRADRALRLFCFPYAGGSTAVFRRWITDLHPRVELMAIQLPGRESRYREPLLTRLPEGIPRLADAIEAEIHEPYAFFGHSLGTLFAFELARELRRRGRPAPRKLIVSGRIAPQVHDPHEPIHPLPRPEFVAELTRLNGTPKEVLALEELMEVMLPVIRADFAMAETYAYTPGPPLDCPISAYGGTEDPRTRPEDLEAWREQTHGSFRLSLFTGDHFFLNSAFDALLRTVNEDLAQVM